MEFRIKKLNCERRPVLTVMQLKNYVPQTNGKKCLSIELFCRMNSREHYANDGVDANDGVHQNVDQCSPINKQLTLLN